MYFLISIGMSSLFDKMLIQIKTTAFEFLFKKLSYIHEKLHLFKLFSTTHSIIKWSYVLEFKDKYEFHKVFFRIHV